MRFPPGFVDEVRRKNDIVEVISEYIPLKRAGKNYKALCPFHTEKTPSFIVSPDKQIFHCFGCGVGGDVIGFVMKIERISFQDAVLRLAERAGMSLKDIDPAMLTREARERERIYKLNELALYFFESNLWGEEGSEALSYLKRRGISFPTIKAFRIGYAPLSRDALLNFMIKKGIYPEELVRAGLVSSSLDGKHYDKFRGRVIFPIMDERGRILGFGGRSLTGEEPKYLNSPETPVFSKKKILFGIDKALKYARSEDRIVLVEGYMDMIKLFQEGIRFTIASLGTSLTERQASLIARYVSRVFIAYDADSAGESATLRGLSLLINKGLRVSVVELPRGSDPDEFVSEHGREAFENLLDRARSFWEFRMEIIFRDYNPSDMENKRATFKKAVEFLSELSEADRALVLPEISRRLGVHERVILKSLRSTRRERGEFKSDVNLILSQKKDAFQKAEEELVLTLLKYPKLLDKFLERGGVELLEDEKMKWILRRILDGFSENEIVGESQENGELAGIVAGMVLRDPPCTEDKLELYFEALLEKLASRRFKKRLEELEEKLRREGSLPKTLYEEYLKLLKQFHGGGWCVNAGGSH